MVAKKKSSEYGKPVWVTHQIKDQLDLEIELEFPASIEADLISDKNKDGETTAAKPNDTTAELEVKR